MGTSRPPYEDGTPASAGAFQPGGDAGPTSLRPEDFLSIRPQLLGVVRRACPGWLAEQAEDIVQSAIVSVLEHRRRSGDDQPVSSSYLTRAAHNAAVDEIRRRFRRPEVAMDDAPDVERHETARPGPGREADSAEIDRAIRACLSKLARPRRSAVTLFLLGYTLRETSDLSGWGVKRSEHLTYRGLADLRRCLQAKGVEP